MTPEEFLNKYEDEDILDIFEETCDFFSQEISEESFDEYDPIDIILDTVSAQEAVKNFENVLRFIEVLQNHQPELYEESFTYLNDILIEYYCFHQDMAKVEEAFSLFIEDPLEDYDKFLEVYKKIMFYQQTELLNRAIVNNYREVNESSEIIGGGYDLALSKLYIILQGVYEANVNDVDKAEILAKLKEYDFDLDKKTFSYMLKGLDQSAPSKKELYDLFKVDKMRVILGLRSYFLHYMYEKGFEFYLSGNIWDEMTIYWEINKEKGESLSFYFKFTTESFEEYLKSFNSMIINREGQMVAALWGSVYVYDFLHQIGFITSELHQDFLKAAQKLKGHTIGMSLPDLWQYDFVHHWEKPDSVSETEFREEHNIFKKSLLIKYDKFSDLKESIADELSNIGELAPYIIEGGKKIMESVDFDFLDNLLSFGDDDDYFDDDYFDDEDFDDEDFDDEDFDDEDFDDEDFDDEDYFDDYIDYDDDENYEPIRKGKKIGRNDPCPCGSGKKYKKCCGE